MSVNLLITLIWSFSQFLLFFSFFVFFPFFLVFFRFFLFSFLPFLSLSLFLFYSMTPPLKNLDMVISFLFHFFLSFLISLFFISNCSSLEEFLRSPQGRLEGGQHWVKRHLLRRLVGMEEKKFFEVLGSV